MSDDEDYTAQLEAEEHRDILQQINVDYEDEEDESP